MHRTNSLKTLQDEIWKRTKHAQAISEEEQSNNNSSKSNINFNDVSFTSQSQHQQSRSNFGLPVKSATSSIASLSKILLKPSGNESISKPSMSCLQQRKLLSMMRINSKVNKLSSVMSNSSFSKLNASVDGGSTILDSQQLSNQPDNSNKTELDKLKAAEKERSRSHLFSISEEPEKEKRKKANILRVMKDISKRLKTQAKDKENSFFNRYIKDYEHLDTYFNVKSVFASLNDSKNYVQRNSDLNSSLNGSESSNQKEYDNKRSGSSNRDDSAFSLAEVTSWLRKLKENSLGNDEQFDKGGEDSLIFDEIKEPTERIVEEESRQREGLTMKINLQETNNSNKACRSSKSHDYSGSNSAKHSKTNEYFRRDSRKSKSIMDGIGSRDSSTYKHLELSQISTNPTMMMTQQFNKQTSNTLSRRSDSSSNSNNDCFLNSRKNTRIRLESVHSSQSVKDSNKNAIKMKYSDLPVEDQESIKTAVDLLMYQLSHATESYGNKKPQEGGQNEEESEMDGFYRNLAQELIKETDSLANNALIQGTQNERIKKEIHSINALIHKVTRQQSQLHEYEQTEAIPTAKQQYLMFRQKSDQVIKLICRGGYSILKSKMLPKKEQQLNQQSSLNDPKNNQDSFKQSYGRRSTLVQIDEPIEERIKELALPEIVKKDKRQLRNEDIQKRKEEQKSLKKQQTQVNSSCQQSIGTKRIGGVRDTEQKDSLNQSIYLTECNVSTNTEQRNTFNQGKQMQVRIQPHHRPSKSLSQDLRNLPSFSRQSNSYYQVKSNSKDIEEERSTTQGSPNFDATTPASPYEGCLLNNFSNVTSPSNVGMLGYLDASPIVPVSMDKPRLRIINSIFRKKDEIKQKISNVGTELDEMIITKRRTSSIDRFKKEVEQEHKIRVAQFEEAKRNITIQAGQIKNSDKNKNGSPINSKINNDYIKNTSNFNRTVNTSSSYVIGNKSVPLSKMKMASTNSPLLQLSKDLKHSSFHQQQYSVKVQRVLYECDMEEIEMGQLKAAYEESKQFQDKRFKALSHHQSQEVLPGLKDLLSKNGE